MAAACSLFAAARSPPNPGPPHRAVISGQLNLSPDSFLPPRAPGERWFALAVRPNHEKTAAAALRIKGFREFLPLYRARRQWCDRIADLQLPLFPGYLFASFDPDVRRTLVVTTPGVLNIVGFGRTPYPVDDREIEAIQAVIKSGFPAEPWPFLSPGAPVRITCGPLASIEGRLLETRKKHRLLVSVTLLQRSIAVDIDSAWASPLVAPKLPPLAVSGQLPNLTH